jgi:predicted nucleotidyltransferase
MQIKLFGEKHLSKKLVDEQTYIVNIKLKNLLKGMKYSNIYKNYILSMLNFDKKLKRVSVKRKNNRELRRWFSKFAR